MRRSTIRPCASASGFGCLVPRCRLERLVLDVEHPAAVQVAGRDRRRESALDERPDEVRALLAVDDAGERAALPLEEDARVHQDVEQESRLAFGEAEAAMASMRSVLASSMVQRSGAGGSVIGSTPR